MQVLKSSLCCLNSHNLYRYREYNDVDMRQGLAKCAFSPVINAEELVVC